MRDTADAGNFAEGRVWRRILAQALPLTLAEIVQVTYTIVDRIYLGHLSEQDSMALIGIGVAFPIIALIGAFTSLYGQGGAPLFAIARGQGRDDRASLLQGCTFTLLLGTGLVIMALFMALRRPMLMLFGASEASYPYADEYMKIYLLGTPFTMIATGMNGFINAQGYPRVGMGTTVLGAAINLVLAVGIDLVLKEIVQRQRPDESIRLVSEVGYSFPSGHSMVSMAFYGLLLWMVWQYEQDRVVKWVCVTGFAILILFVGISRIYLGVHYASDVIAGFAVSAIWLAVYTKVAVPILLGEDGEQPELML